MGNAKLTHGCLNEHRLRVLQVVQLQEGKSQGPVVEQLGRAQCCLLEVQGVEESPPQRRV
jgi:hypothetical protein